MTRRPGHAPTEPQTGADDRPGWAMSDSWFDGPECRNCGAALTGPHCSACGQKRSGRLGVQTVGNEAWSRLRWFEFDFFRAAFRVLKDPGGTARRYVLGARQRFIHPLKLLLSLIVLLVLLLGHVGYLTASSTPLNKALELVASYSKWSFSLGVFAVAATTLTLFARVQSFNWVEHLVLAAYAHSAVLMVNLLNLAPLLIWGSAETILAHRSAAALYMTPIETGIVVYAIWRFFELDLRRAWLWLAVAGAAFWLIKKGLIYLFSRAIIQMALSQLT